MLLTFVVQYSFMSREIFASWMVNPVESISYSNKWYQSYFTTSRPAVFACRFHSAVELLLRCWMMITASRIQHHSMLNKQFFKQYLPWVHHELFKSARDLEEAFHMVIHWSELTELSTSFLPKRTTLCKPQGARQSFISSVYTTRKICAVTLIMPWDPMAGLWRHCTADFHLFCLICRKSQN